VFAEDTGAFGAFDFSFAGANFLVFPVGWLSLLDVVGVGGVPVDVPPSAYAIVGPIALKIKTAMMTNE